MTKITAMDLRPFYRNAIGVDRLFDRIINQIDTGSTTTTNYPPFNTVKTGEHTYELQIAIAGFSQGEVAVNINENELTVTGEKVEAELPEGYVYEHKGISDRRWIRSFTLDNYVEVKSAIAKDGILTIKLERKLPESMKPKTIAITYES